MKIPKREGFTGEHHYPTGLPVRDRLSMIWGALKTLVPAMWSCRSFSYVVYLEDPKPSSISVLMAVNPEQLRVIGRKFDNHFNDTMAQLYLAGHRRDD